MLLAYPELCEIVEQGVITNVDPKLINGSSIDVTLGADLLVEEYPDVLCPKCGALQERTETLTAMLGSLRSMMFRSIPQLCIECGTSHPFGMYIKPIDLSRKESIKLRSASMADGHVLWPGDTCLAHTEQLFYLPAHISADYRLNSTAARSFLEQLHAAWCFVGDTRISMVSGEEKPIAEITEGELVYSINKEGCVVPGTVIKSGPTAAVNDLVTVHLSYGETFTCTPEHLILLRSGIYVEAKNLHPANWVMAVERGAKSIAALRVLSVVKEHYPNHVPVYDLTIDQHHNFALASGTVVHNCDPYWHNAALTLELVNLNRFHPIVLRAGQKLGQIVFMRHTPVPEDKSYKVRGRYNGTTTVSGARQPV